jgi:hypothetical protein
MIVRPTIAKWLLNKSIAGLFEHKLKAVHGAPNVQEVWMLSVNHILKLFYFLTAGNSYLGHQVILSYHDNYFLCKQQVIIGVGIRHPKN